jgi:hypothetical protein
LGPPNRPPKERRKERRREGKKEREPEFVFTVRKLRKLSKLRNQERQLSSYD